MIDPASTPTADTIRFKSFSNNNRTTEGKATINTTTTTEVEGLQRLQTTPTGDTITAGAVEAPPGTTAATINTGITATTPVIGDLLAEEDPI